MNQKCVIGGVVASLFAVSGAAGELFQPDSATASSEFNGSYDIGNTIDGSGLAGGLSPTALHGNYAANNHWTTRRDAVDVTATFRFDEAKDIARFYLWNHRSNVIADDPFYAVKTFNLTFEDAMGEELASFSGLSAERDVAAAQVYDFALISGVSSVRIDIVENHGSRLSGFAEVAFSSVPAPATGGVLLGLVGFAARRRA